MNVVHLETPEKERVVAALRDLLERAESGEIVGFAAAYACAGRATASSYIIGDAVISDLYLALARIQLRLLEIE